MYLLKQVHLGFQPQYPLTYGSEESEISIWKLFLQLRQKLFEYISQENLIHISERGRIQSELKLEDVIGYFKDVLGSSFWPLCDLIVSQLYKYKIDLLKRQHEQEKKELIQKIADEQQISFEEAKILDEERSSH